jgi:hypothetical protein
VLVALEPAELPDLGTVGVGAQWRGSVALVRADAGIPRAYQAELR